MVFDATRPAGSRKIRLSDDDLRENNAALESALSEGHEFTTGGDQTGKHTTPTFIDNEAEASTPSGSNEVVLYNNGGVLKMKDSGSTVKFVSDIPSGTKMLFKQSSAPTGWTFVAEDDWKMIANTNTEADGGSTGGDWDIASCLSVDNHTLTVNEIPAHDHSLNTYDSSEYYSDVVNLKDSNAGGGLVAGRYADVESTMQWVDSDGDGNDLMQDTGGGSGHNHGISNNGSWTPAYVKVITCSKS